MGWREIGAATSVLARGNLSRFSTRGTSRTSQFESELGRYTGAAHVLATNSGTSALVCALVGTGVGPGDEVLVPAYTWVSTAAAALAVGAVPILVEIDETLGMDPIDAKRKVTDRTAAIVPVHMLNLVADLDALGVVARDAGAALVEDACQAIGVRYRDRYAGAVGDAGAFSFNQQKNIRSGEGGAVLTSDARVYARAGMYHDVGSYTRAEQFDTDEPLFVGVNLRMPELSAAILRPQLRRLRHQMAERAARRAVVIEELGGIEGLRISPHNDPEHATGVTVVFETADDAVRFAAAGAGIHRLLDTGRHVYTNWVSILERRTFHPRFDPYEWVGHTIEQDADSCPVTLDVLSRTCSVSVKPGVPTPVLRRILRRAVGRAAPAAGRTGSSE